MRVESRKIRSEWSRVCACSVDWAWEEQSCIFPRLWAQPGSLFGEQWLQLISRGLRMLGRASVLSMKVCSSQFSWLTYCWWLYLSANSQLRSLSHAGKRENRWKWCLQWHLSCQNKADVRWVEVSRSCCGVLMKIRLNSHPILRLQADFSIKYEMQIGQDVMHEEMAKNLWRFYVYNTKPSKSTAFLSGCICGKARLKSS